MSSYKERLVKDVKCFQTAAPEIPFVFQRPNFWHHMQTAHFFFNHDPLCAMGNTQTKTAVDLGNGILSLGLTPDVSYNLAC